MAIFNSFQGSSLKSRCSVLVTAMAVSICVTDGHAQSGPTKGLGGSVGVLHTQAEGTGISLTGSFVLSTPFISLSLIPIDLGIMPQDPDARYRSETFSNGNTVCRDHETGQFADDAQCGPRYAYAASADLLAALPIGSGKSFAVGGGYRLGNSAGLYGAASLFVGPVQGNNWQVKARAGKDFIDVGIAGLYRMRR